MESRRAQEPCHGVKVVTRRDSNFPRQVIAGSWKARVTHQAACGETESFALLHEFRVIHEQIDDMLPDFDRDTGRAVAATLSMPDGQ